VDGVPYTWDDWGNLTHDGTFTYTYNAAGRLARAESVTSTLVYTYNAGGLRVAQSVDGNATSGGATTFAWDWASGLPEVLRDGASYGIVHSPVPRGPRDAGRVGWQRVGLPPARRAGQRSPGGGRRRRGDCRP